MDLRVKSQRAPSDLNSSPSQVFCSWFLSAKDMGEITGFFQIPFRPNVRIDGPEDRRLKFSGKSVSEPIVDIHKEIIFPRMNLGYLLWLKMKNLMSFAQSPQTKDPGRIWAFGLIKDDRNSHFLRTFKIFGTACSWRRIQTSSLTGSIAIQRFRFQTSGQRKSNPVWARKFPSKS